MIGSIAKNKVGNIGLVLKKETVGGWSGIQLDPKHIGAFWYAEEPMILAKEWSLVRLPQLQIIRRKK